MRLVLNLMPKLQAQTLNVAYWVPHWTPLQWVFLHILSLSQPFTSFKPNFYLLQKREKLVQYQSSKGLGLLLEQEANPAVNTISKSLKNCQLLSLIPQGVANYHYIQLIDASAGVTYHDAHIKDSFISLTLDVLLIWVSLNEGLIASPLNIWFCSINLITSDSSVYSTKLHYSPTPACNSIIIRAMPTVISKEHHYSRWFQISNFILHVCLPLGFTVWQTGFMSFRIESVSSSQLHRT